MIDNRSHKRFLRQLKVTWRDKKGSNEGAAINVGAGGAFIATHNPMPKDEIVELEFSLGNETPPVHCRAKVIWISDEQTQSHASGFAVDFLDIDRDSVMRLIEPYYEDF
jgi:uncharacterized protein (TIGR02266 family)